MALDSFFRDPLLALAVWRCHAEIYDVLGIDQSSEDHRRVLAVVRYLSA